MKILETLSKIWNAIKPDPYFYIASLMEMEEYSEFEIELEIARLKEANGDE